MKNVDTFYLFVVFMAESWLAAQPY